jgi:hypothetical protein
VTHPTKKLEAFCDHCLTTLCIDCILSDDDKHRSHEILSVPKALSRQRAYLSEELSLALRTETRLLALSEELERHSLEIDRQTERNLESVTAWYEWVLEVVRTREEQVRRQVEGVRRREREEVEAKQAEVAEWVERIRSVRGEWERAEDEAEIEVLEQARRRRDECLEINGQKGRELVSFNLAAFTH